MVDLSSKASFGLAVALTAWLLAAPPPALALTQAQLAAITQVSAAATAKFAQANQAGQLPRYKDPASRPLLARIWNVGPLIGNGPWSSDDVGPLLDLADMEKAVFRAYVTHPKMPGGPSDPASSEIEFHDEAFRSMAAMLEIGAASVYALADFIKALPPDQINDARRSGIAQMRAGFKQELAGSLLMLENPRSPHDEADGILTKALSASAAGFASAMTKDDRAAVAAALRDAIAHAPAARQGDLRTALPPFQSEQMRWALQDRVSIGAGLRHVSFAQCHPHPPPDQVRGLAHQGRGLFTFMSLRLDGGGEVEATVYLRKAPRLVLTGTAPPALVSRRDHQAAPAVLRGIFVLHHTALSSSLRALSVVFGLAAILPLCASARAQTFAPPPDHAAEDPAARALFMERCSGCHDQAGGRAPATAYLATRLPSEIYYTLTRGEMRQQAAGLDDGQLKALATLLTGRPMDVEPSPDANRCATPGGIAADPKEWPSWGHDVHNTRFQTDPGFGVADLPRLKVKWAFALPGLTGSPIAAGGRLFVSSRMGKVFALNAKTGCTDWAYDAGGPVRNAIAVGDIGGGRHGAFFGDQNAIVHALDAATGQELWQKRVDDYAGARIVGSITYYDGRLYVPVTSGDEVDADDPSYQCCKFRGSVVALDAATGDQIWKAYTIQQEPGPTRVNSAGTQMYGPSGAGVWSAPTVDAKRGIVFVGTGDSYTADPNDASDAVIAFDLRTGKRLWVSQVLKNDAWIYQCAGQPVGNCPSPMGPDYDFSSPPLLQTMANGKDILVAGSKSAKVYGFDPDAEGRILWSATVGQGNSGIQIWGSAADRDRVYVATPGAGLKPDTAGGLSGIALTDGTIEWRTEAPTPLCGWGERGCFHAQPGAVTLIPGAVFSGALDGHLRAYDVTSGAILWDMDTAQTYDAVNGVKAFGGNLDAAPQTVADGTLFVNAGNSALGSPRHGDAVLAITVDGK